MNPELSSEQASDLRYLDPKVPLSGNFSHLNWANTLSQLFNKPGLRVLEIGSREVTGPSKARKQLFAQATYVGMDVQAGPNVDIVGDAHRLSSYFDEAEPFDLIHSSAVFEHLAMPWVVAGEIAKLLKVGGCVFVETHFSFTSHERPWHFFQFSDQALKVLFAGAWLSMRRSGDGQSNERDLHLVVGTLFTRSGRRRPLLPFAIFRHERTLSRAANLAGSRP